MIELSTFREKLWRVDTHSSFQSFDAKSNRIELPALIGIVDHQLDHKLGPEINRRRVPVEPAR